MKNQITNKLLAFTNPVVGGNLGGQSDEAVAAARDGSAFVGYFVTIWNAIITVGAIMVLINFLWGALEWITAGGDSSKVEKGRNRITQSMIGLLILVSSFVIIGFINEIFFGDDFDILDLNFTVPENATGEETNTEGASSINFFAPPIAYADEIELEGSTETESINDSKSVNLNIGSAAKFADLPGTANYNPDNAESGFGELISRILSITMIIGAIMVLINFLWGGLEWITAGGDSSKVEKGRNRITQSIVGIIVLASVVALFILIQKFLGLEVLEFSFV